MKNLSVEVTIVGRLARTQVTQVFWNDLPRQTEGRYTFVLPDGASISRLAMDVNGKMMEGELVTRERARRIYESIVSRRKDPALLEWQGQNRFSTQIFPIPARGPKTVVLTYEQVLPQQHDTVTYLYDLPHLAEDAVVSSIDTFSFSLKTAGASKEVRMKNYVGETLSAP